MNNAMQKGMDIARAFFEDVGLPMLEKDFPEYKEYMVCGLVGEGSECFGYDDEVSRDHDFGADFCIWLPDKIYNDIKIKLSKKYSELIFDHFSRRNVSKYSDGRIGVLEEKHFYRLRIGRDNLPHKLVEWLVMPEDNLAEVTNGEVFYIGEAVKNGYFLRFRNGLKEYYPEDIRIKKISAKAAKAAQSGQYNYVRSIKRGDMGAAFLSVGVFVQTAMQLVFLLNKRYAPYYKWLYRGLRDLTVLGKEISEKFKILFSKQPMETVTAVIEEISIMIINEMQRQRLTDCRSDFLLDHCLSLMEHIKDEEIRGLYFVAE